MKKLNASKKPLRLETRTVRPLDASALSGVAGATDGYAKCTYSNGPACPDPTPRI